MIVKEFKLKNEIHHDGIYVAKKLFEYLSVSNYNHRCFVFKSNFICNFLNIESCLNIQEVDKQILLKTNSFSAICLLDEKTQIEDFLLKYYDNDGFNEKNSFYNEEVFGGYCLSPNAFNKIYLYKVILFLHHDFQNLFLIQA